MGKVKEILGTFEGDDGSSRKKRKPDDIDVLDEQINNLELEEVREAKLGRIKVYRLEQELKAKELEEELNKRKRGMSPKTQPDEEGESSGISPMDIETAKALKDLPESERKQVLSLIPLLKMSPNSESSSMLMALTLLPMLSGKNSEDQAVTTVKVLSAVKELTKDNSGLKIDLAGLISSIGELAKGGESKENPVVLHALQALVDRGLNPPQNEGFVESVLNDPNKQALLERLLGKTDNAELLRLQKEINESNRKWDLALQEYNRKYDLELRKLELESGKTDRLDRMLSKIVGAAERALSQEGEESNIQTQTQTQTQTQSQPQIQNSVVHPENNQAGKPRVVSQKCPTSGCNNLLSYTSDQVGSTITCVKCGSTYEITPETAPETPKQNPPTLNTGHGLTSKVTVNSPISGSPTDQQPPSQ